VSEHMLPPTLPTELSGLVDPDGGFLCWTMHWLPNPKDPDPNMPGQKMSMISYIPVGPDEDCLCGSGKPYRACCQRPCLWRPICPNPGMQGYSLLASQSATFHNVDGPVIRERLMADTRLRCVDESPDNSFWIFWGGPPVQDRHGILCFGDVALKQNHTLLVTAMSDLRMRVLLDLLQEIAGDYLGTPQMSRDPLVVIDKTASRARLRLPQRNPSRRRRKR
jgi:hypothetical protein